MKLEHTFIATICTWTWITGHLTHTSFHRFRWRWKKNSGDMIQVVLHKKEEKLYRQIGNIYFRQCHKKRIDIITIYMNVHVKES